ncbi:hypothetical protein DAPPUDRAFT_246230 [Daphnia pulex]|uniref:Uncharacterized protein n=1 Tax=Daphnia pulex TaxID=6669 RepID=E9GPX4_DAPPU|nr:hypothetical protein DAPPUDRAFT_246230 [Daphnia pulex]|eukprot:EFX78461.1 hypothetical protein DAPPUDRAFT_246230 [Daphnia pulex]
MTMPFTLQLRLESIGQADHYLGWSIVPAITMVSLRSHRVHLADSHRYRRPSLLPTQRTTAWGDISKETVKPTSAGVEDRQHLTKIGLAGTRKTSYRFAMESVRGGQRAESAGRRSLHEGLPEGQSAATN